MLTPDNEVIVFVDGQNLFHLAREAWGHGYHWPRYDVTKLARELVALEPGRTLKQVRFYSGVPTVEQNAQWHAFWTAKLRVMKSDGVVIYRGRILNGREKGVDVRLALDLVRLAREGSFDTAVVVSQDSDLNEALREVVAIAKQQHRRMVLESAFPYEPGAGMSRRGLTPSKWRPIDRGMYDRCADPRDYRLRPKPPEPEPSRPVTIQNLKDRYNR